MQLFFARLLHMTKKIDDLHLAAWRTFITAHATLIDLIDHELQAAGCIPLHWYDVLVELAEAPGRRLRLHELASSVVLSRSGLTRLVDRLETAGLLSRQPDPSDRRGAFAVLTDDGLAALRKSWPVYANGIVKFFSRNLTEAEANVVKDVFQRILKTAHAT